MLEVVTKISEATNLDDLPEALDALCGAGQVGAVVLRRLLPVYDRDRLIRGAEFGTVQKLRAVRRGIKQYFTEGLGRDVSCKTVDRGAFTHEHDWHIAQTGTQPKIKLWSLLRGRADFSVARAQSFDQVTGYGFTDEVVAQSTKVPPAKVTTEAGDALLFIDYGSRFTGPSSFHKVQPLGNEAQRQERLSRAWDLEVRI